MSFLLLHRDSSRVHFDPCDRLPDPGELLSGPCFALDPPLLELPGLLEQVCDSEQRAGLVRAPEASRPSTSGYNKNIFRYIIRRSFKLAVSSHYSALVESLCAEESADYPVVRQILEDSIEQVSGIQFLENVVRGAEGRAIRRYLEWFLKHRYFRHLNKSGRMHDQLVYLNFKNKFVLRELQRLSRPE